ncbi:MAG: MATE family efflux transporter [Oscillospiraceae bacterium]|jgi:putative MATE family efflux protein|nr:MATE family efflux transporter [Oscillospiraceae bacterium]
MSSKIANLLRPKERSGDMTQGNILRRIVMFSLPLLAGSVLQQLYNAVDAIVVGHYVGSAALGAVTLAGPVVAMMVALFVGMSSGATVIISRFFGAGDRERLEEAVHTAMMLTVIIGAALSIIGVVFTPTLLSWMSSNQAQTAEMMSDAVTYVRIYFAGLIGLTVYNMGSGILQAVGNSRYPLYFLLISAILNTLGDLLLVVVFNMGVSGAAYATIGAQALSAAFVVLVLCRSKHSYKLNIKRLRISKFVARNIMSIGLPSAVQGAIVSASNILVQAYLIGLNNDSIVAGNGTANSLNSFIQLPVQVMAVAVTTFVSQNLGAGNVARARRGTRDAMFIGIGVSVVLSALALIFHEGLLTIFSPKAEVLRYGWEFMRVYTPFYFVLSCTQILPGALRGAGDVKVATIASVGCFVVLRQVYLFIVTKTQYTVFNVALGYPATWTLCALIILIHYLRSNWTKFEREKQLTVDN